MAVIKNDDIGFIQNAIEERIKKQANDMYNELVNTAVADLRRRMEDERDKIIASVAIRIAKVFKVDQLHDDLIIKIDTSDLIKEAPNGKN